MKKIPLCVISDLKCARSDRLNVREFSNENLLRLALRWRLSIFDDWILLFIIRFHCRLSPSHTKVMMLNSRFNRFDHTSISLWQFHCDIDKFKSTYHLNHQSNQAVYTIQYKQYSFFCILYHSLFFGHMGVEGTWTVA